MAITKDSILESKVSFIEPDVLSKRDSAYFENYARKLTPSDVESLCSILLNSNKELFTPKNVEAIHHYDFIKIGKKAYSVGSWRVKDILLEIKQNNYDKEDVLHDTSKLLSKHEPAQLALKVEVYNYLIDKGYLSEVNKK